MARRRRSGGPWRATSGCPKAATGRGRAIVVRGRPGRGGRFRRGRPDAAAVAWASRFGRAGIVRWSVTAVTAWLPAMVLVEPLHGLTFALLHLACMQMLSVVAPPALAATAQGIYGGVAVGTMTAVYDPGIRPTLRRARPARILGHGAALCRCVAGRVRDARDFDQCTWVEADRIAVGYRTLQIALPMSQLAHLRRRANDQELHALVGPDP